jgi:nucleoside-diphosphate-sugar epimerase
MSRNKVVLITGANGNLGRKLRKHLEAQGGYELRLLDLHAAGTPGVVAADLSVYDDTWARHFAGVDAVLHLAAQGSPQIDWPTAQRFNIDLTLNVYDAAARKGAKRMVFASSNWVMAGYRFDDVRLTTDLPPRPLNPYGVSKLMGERAGKSLAEQRHVPFIGLRIGYCQDGENRPGPQMGQGLWGQRMWLSNRDLCHGWERAILAEEVRFAVLNLMSDNPDMPWDIEQTRQVIGYQPQDRHAAVSTDDQTRRSQALCDKYRLVDGLDWVFAAGEW